MNDLLNQVAEYYNNKIVAHGQTPAGVDWNSAESQSLRFTQLSKVLPEAGAFTVNDLGCGYGALFDFLEPRYPQMSYYGYDIAPEMISAAQQRHQGRNNARYFCTAQPTQPADFTIVSGIFNVRMNRTETEWVSYIEETLDLVNKISRLGFAFNCLTDYSDADKKRDDLHYASPTGIFDFCKRHFSRNVALLHDYDLYEFTLIVRKDR